MVERGIQTRVQEQRQSLLCDDDAAICASTARSGGIPAPDGRVTEDASMEATHNAMDMRMEMLLHLPQRSSGNGAESTHRSRKPSTDKRALRRGVRWQALRRDTAFNEATDPLAGVPRRETPCLRSRISTAFSFFFQQQMPLHAPACDNASASTNAVSRRRLAIALHDAKRFCPCGEEKSQETVSDSGGRNASSPRRWQTLMHGGLAAMSLLMFTLMTPAPLSAQIPPPPGAPTESVPLPHPEIAPPDFPSWTLTPWWVVVGGIILGLALLSALAWYALLPKSLRPPSLRHAPLKSAMDSLEALRGRVQEMAPTEVAHDVSLIIRMYLQQSYAVPAPYRTTEEIYRSAALSTREPLKHRFEPVAVFYDQVEFAPRPRTVQDSEGLVEAALEALREEQRLMAQPAFVTGAPGMPLPASKMPPPLPPDMSAVAPSASAPAETGPVPKLSLSKDSSPPSSPAPLPSAASGSDSAVSSSTSGASPVSNPP